MRCAPSYGGSRRGSRSVLPIRGRRRVSNATSAHTHYGEWQGKFAGSGTRLFVRGIGLWLMMIGSFVAYAFALTFINSVAPMRAAGAGSMDATTVIAVLIAA